LVWRADRQSLGADQPLLPAGGKPGGRWSDHRMVIDGILWKLRTGAPWQDLPERYGPWTTCHDQYVRWRRDGTWDRLLAHAQTKSDAVGEVEWVVSVDAGVIRAHQHAVGARRRPAQAEPKGGPRTRRMRRWGTAGAG
jgi:transposase